MKRQENESLVFISEEWSSLRYGNVVENSICLKNQPFKEQNGTSIIYHRNVDYVVDVEKGRIKRTAQSRMPDWSQNVFYNQMSFDHTQYDSYGNDGFTVYIDYEYDDLIDDCNRSTYPSLLQNTGMNLSQKLISKLRAGKIRYVVYGDSISTGAEASIEENKYFNRFADHIRYLYPECSVDVRMQAVGGEDSNGGLRRIHSDVVALNPDIVTIAYGMNDQNLNEQGGHFVEPDVFERNIGFMVETVRNSTDAEVILLTPCLPNPKWKYSSGDAGLYGEAIRNAGKKYNVAVADVQSLWLQELRAGKSHESLLMNNINHPNDYGHWIYFKALEKFFR